MPIKTFNDARTLAIWKEEPVADFPPELLTISLRKLNILHASKSTNDLRVPPGNRLEKLEGFDNKWSIRINNQWRIVFGWNNGDATDVSINKHYRK